MSYKKLAASEKSGRLFLFFSDEAAVLGTSEDKLENFWAKSGVIRW